MSLNTSLFQGLCRHEYYRSYKALQFDFSKVCDYQPSFTGDKVTFNYIKSGAVTVKPKADFLGNCEPKKRTCLTSGSFEMELVEGIDELFALNKCRLSQLEGLTEESVNGVITDAVTGTDNNVLAAEVNSFYNTIVPKFQLFETDQTQVQDIVEDMIVQLIEDNKATGSMVDKTDVIVVLNTRETSNYRKLGYNCCELWGKALKDISNVWNVGLVMEYPAVVNDTNLPDIMVYIKDDVKHGDQCVKREVYQSTTDGSRGDVMFDYQGLWGTKAVTSADIEIVAYPGLVFSREVVTPGLLG